MEDGEWQQQHTLEDVFYSVLNSKSVGRLSRNSRLGQKNRQTLASSLSGSKPRPEGETRPALRPKPDQLKDGKTSGNDNHQHTPTSTPIDHSPPPPSPPLHLRHYSTSKLRKTHSISTPELHSKVMLGGCAGEGLGGVPKPRAAREVDFLRHPLEKENEHPGIIHIQSSTSSSSSSFVRPFVSSSSLLHPTYSSSSSSSFSSSSHKLTSSSSLSHLHTIPSSSSSSSSSSSFSSLRQPLQELATPWKPPQHHRKEGVPTDLPSPSPVPPRQRRRGLLRRFPPTTTTTTTTATTPSPPQGEIATTTTTTATTTATSTHSPSPPTPAVGSQRSTPLVRSRHVPQHKIFTQQTYSRSNTAGEVEKLLHGPQQVYSRSNTAGEVEKLLHGPQQTYSRSNTAGEVEKLLHGPQQTNSRSNTAAEMDKLLSRSQQTHSRFTTAAEVGSLPDRPQHPLSRSNTAAEVGTLLNRPQQGYSRSHTAAEVNTALSGPHAHSPPQTTDAHGAGTHTPTDAHQHTRHAHRNTHTNAHTNTPQLNTADFGARGDNNNNNNNNNNKEQPPPPPQAAPTPPAPPVPPISPSDVLTVNGKTYLKLQLLGRGGSSRVYEVLDKDSRQVRAVKVVNLENLDEDTLTSYKNEISILEKLRDCNCVIHLYDHEVTGSQLVLVMEKGSLDFTAILNEARTKKNSPIPFFTIQHYWAGMLRAVQQIHQHGIIHSDLKPANFLLVDGTVKLIDFGIASSIQHDMTSVVKDSQAGTFNYMSPESLLDIHSGPIVNNCAAGRPTIKIRVKSDVWSLGCILYNLVYGRTPFQHITNPLQKLAAISNPRTRIDFPDVKNSNLLDVMRLCLQYDPHRRPSIEELLAHPLLTG